MNTIKHEIDKMDIESKISLVMEIWDGISKENKSIEFPDNHKRIIEQRLEDYKSGNMRFYSWDNLRDQLLK